MLDILGLITAHSINSPDKIALVDNNGASRITYAQIDYLSGKVYAYLKKLGIGKEDFVAICLPRSAQPVIAMVGIWKAGAAYVMLEENYAPERTALIIENCHCKLTIDSERWNEIQSMEYLPGYESVEPHQAALAVYTSGSTGTPKGVLHEFGNIDRIHASANYNGVRYVEENDAYALLSPLSFIAGCGTAMMCLINGAAMHILPYDTIKNPILLEAYILEKKITKISLSPTLFQALRSISPYLQMVILGGEPISDLYTDKVQLMSAYSMSECGAMIATFEIDRPYHKTPIGKPQCDMKLWLLDEDGNEVPDGESGELCVDNPYVRGYIGLPELNASAFGENGIYHTGDIARKLPDGNYILLGRSNEMIKISGNRVEPAEVEAAVKKALDIDWCAVKGFTKENSTFICAYYVADITPDDEATRQKMLELVPYYMVPSHFIKLDHIPQNANGKVDKKALQPPSFDDFRAPYAAPTNALEEKLCKAFEIVLEMEHIGIHDDFYKLGGDSLDSIMLVAECNIKRLSINDVFRGRTPKGIAELFLSQNRHHEPLPEEDSEVERERKMRLPHSLTPEQIYMVDYQFYTPKSTMYNLGGMFRLGEGIDAQKLADAMNTAVAAHPALNTVFSFTSDGDIIQRYIPEVSEPIAVENVTEAELDVIKQTLIRPFKIMHSCLFRGSVFKTELACYMFLDVHHTICDGTSYHILLRDIEAAYNGRIFAQKDCYYELLRARERMTEDPFYPESKAYYEKNYSREGYASIPTPDIHRNVHTMGALEAELHLSAKAVEQVCACTKISRNGFFITAGLLAMAAYNNTGKVRGSWIYNGRDTVEEMNTMGLLIRFLPVAVDLKPDDSVLQLLSNIHTQIIDGLKHSCYPYTVLEDSCVLDDSMCLLYQEKLKSAEDLHDMPMEHIPVPYNNPAFQNTLDIEIMDTENGFSVLMEYAESTYSATAMENFMNLFRKVAGALTAAAEHSELTVADILSPEYRFDEK